MLGLITLGVVAIVGIWTLRGKGMGWLFAIPLGLIPALPVLFLGLLGLLLSALILSAYFKIDLPV